MQRAQQRSGARNVRSRHRGAIFDCDRARIAHVGGQDGNARCGNFRLDDGLAADAGSRSARTEIGDHVALRGEVALQRQHDRSRGVGRIGNDLRVDIVPVREDHRIRGAGRAQVDVGVIDEDHAGGARIERIAAPRNAAAAAIVRVQMQHRNALLVDRGRRRTLETVGENTFARGDVAIERMRIGECRAAVVVAVGETRALRDRQVDQVARGLRIRARAHRQADRIARRRAGRIQIERVAEHLVVGGRGGGCHPGFDVAHGRCRGTIVAGCGNDEDAGVLRAEESHRSGIGPRRRAAADRVREDIDDAIRHRLVGGRGGRRARASSQAVTRTANDGVTGVVGNDRGVRSDAGNREVAAGQGYVGVVAGRGARGMRAVAVAVGGAGFVGPGSGRAAGIAGAGTVAVDEVVQTDQLVVAMAYVGAAGFAQAQIISRAQRIDMLVAIERAGAGERWAGVVDARIDVADDDAFALRGHAAGRAAVPDLVSADEKGAAVGHQRQHLFDVNQQHVVARSDLGGFGAGELDHHAVDGVLELHDRAERTLDLRARIAEELVLPSLQVTDVPGRFGRFRIHMASGQRNFRVTRCQAVVGGNRLFLQNHRIASALAVLHVQDNVPGRTFGDDRGADAWRVSPQCERRVRRACLRAGTQGDGDGAGQRQHAVIAKRPIDLHAQLSTGKCARHSSPERRAQETTTRNFKIRTADPSVHGTPVTASPRQNRAQV